MITNLHERIVEASPEACWSLIERLGTPLDRFWPHHRWSPIHLEGPLAQGTLGGHGPLRYEVEQVVPRQVARFRFNCPYGATGHHSFEVTPCGEGRTRLAHRLEMTASLPAVFSWYTGLKFLHDALMEDALDCAQQALEPLTTLERRPLPFHIRALRAFGSRRLRAFRPLDITPEELEAELFNPSLR